jgi:hypothetical protein
MFQIIIIIADANKDDRLCGLVVRVLGYRSGGPGSITGTTENTAVGIRHADHVASSIRKKLAFNSPTSGGCSVGTVRSRTQTLEFSLDANNDNYIYCSRFIQSDSLPT